MATVMNPAPAHASAHSPIKLHRLNADYIEAFLKSDTDWFERNLASDFRCILSSGELLDRAAFLARAAQPAAMASFTVEDVEVEFEGDTAVVQARTVFERADGRRGQSRYTDVWVGRDGRWQALTAQITEITAP
jgi:ketosteroid isomerase-like protein